MKTFIVILLTAKIGFIANDNITGYKLMEKGFKEEDLALTVLINFPLQIVFGYYAARWSKEPRRLLPWSLAFYGRLSMAVLAMMIVHFVPETGISTSYFALVIASSVASSFMRYFQGWGGGAAVRIESLIPKSTVQFVSMGAFFAAIADPAIGGTYMTVGVVFWCMDNESS